MSVQTSFAGAARQGLPGLVGDINPMTSRSFSAEGVIPFGHAVQVGTDPQTQRKVAQGGAYKGMAIREEARESTTGAYADHDDAAVMIEGYMFAKVIGTGAVGAALTYLTTSGQLTTAAADVTHIVTPCTLEETLGTSGDLVLVRVKEEATAGLTATVAINSAHVAGDGSDHADVATNTAAIALIEDDHVRAACLGVDAATDEDEITADLSGDAASYFVPTHYMIVVADLEGTAAGDGTLNIGTATGGTQIKSAQALTNLDTIGDCLMVPLSSTVFAGIAGDAAIYANVEAADSTATSLILDVYLVGRQFTLSA